jgi:RND superfamily putative drug exporter
MLGLARWCIGHRRSVVIAWVFIAIGTTVVATVVGRNYSTNFELPGTDAQRASTLLMHEFKTQSGDLDQIVFHTSTGTVDQPAVRSQMTSVFNRAAALPHVAYVVSPYARRGAQQVSKDRRTAFAVVAYDKRANQLKDTTGKPLIALVDSVRIPGVQVAAGGAVVEQGEGFSVGPATTVGVIAALIILLITFGSLTAAGMPLITAGFGLVTGVALIGLVTNVFDMPSTAPELALMIGLGVGVDYALFITTRFKEAYGYSGDVRSAIETAMDTSGRAILLAGATVIIALLGMFATGVAFLYGLAVASVLAVLAVLTASLTLLPSLLVGWGPKVVRPIRRERKRAERGEPPRPSRWREWSKLVQSRPWPLALASFAVVILFLLPAVALRLDNTDAGNNAKSLNSRRSFDMLAQGFGAGFNGPLLVVAQLPNQAAAAELNQLRAAVASTPDIGAVAPVRLSPSGKVAVLQAYPDSAPQALATTDLVNHLRDQVIPPVEQRTGIHVLVGGFTAGSIDFAHVLSKKLPLFIGVVIVLSALLLFVIFRSLVIPLQAAVMNLLSIGGAVGATVAIFQWGWLGGVIGVQPGPIEPWIPVLMFAVVFGLSMDYEVFLVSRVREEWVRGSKAGDAVADGIAYTGRVISAAAAIMICVFLSFIIGDQRVLKEFGFGLGAAVFIDAVVIRCVMLPAVLELFGERTWWLPGWLDRLLPHINIEGTDARGARAGTPPPPSPERDRVGTPA